MTKVKEIMTPDPHTVQTQLPVQQVALKMRELDLGALPVVQTGKLVGMITDRDITVRAAAVAMEAANTPVSEIMSGTCLCCREDDDMGIALQGMIQHKVRRMPVVNGNENLVGILSLADIAKKHDASQSSQLLLSVSQP